MQTKRTAPDSILIKNIGPAAPLEEGSTATTQKTTLPIKPNITVPNQNDTPATKQKRLQQEAQEAVQIHNTVTNSLPDSNPLKVAGQSLSQVIQNMTPGGIAIIVPALQDFRTSALDYLQNSTPQTYIVDTSSAPVSQLVNYIVALPGPVRAYLNSAVSSLLVQQQNSASRDMTADLQLLGDLLSGYPKLVSGLGTLAETLATQAPRIIGEIGADMRVPGLEGIALSLTSLSQEVYIAYAEANAEVLSTHKQLSKSAQKRQDVLKKISEFTTQAQIVSSAIQALNASNSYNNIDTIVSQIESQIQSKVQVLVNAFAKKLEQDLINSITRKPRENTNAIAASLAKSLGITTTNTNSMSGNSSNQNTRLTG